MPKSRRINVSEAHEILGVDVHFIADCVRFHWISPADPAESLLDEEDLARLQLIHVLKEELGVNDEAVPIILSLLDQIYLLSARAGKAA